MRDRLANWRTATALAVSLLVAAVTAAAPPDDRSKDAGPPGKIDKDVDAYVLSLAEKITDRHAIIRDSIATPSWRSASPRCLP